MILITDYVPRKKDATLHCSGGSERVRVVCACVRACVRACVYPTQREDEA